MLGDDYKIIEQLESIYQTQALEFIRKGYSYICQGKVAGYNEFKEELKMVKEILIETNYEDYQKIFKQKDNVYESYMKFPLKKNGSTTYKEAFYRAIEKGLQENTKEEYQERINQIRLEIEKGCFLEKQTTVENAYIPYQLQLKEVEAIIDNQSKYYPFLKEEKERIIKILIFRIPYYVGPLNNESSFAWVERKKGMEKEKIYPWNFDKVIDCDRTAEIFITRMTNKCNYFRDKEVLPKCSLLYTDYMFYNEINKVKINGVFLDVETKQDLFEEILLRKTKSISEKMIQKWAQKNN